VICADTICLRWPFKTIACACPCSQSVCTPLQVFPLLSVTVTADKHMCMHISLTCDFCRKWPVTLHMLSVWRRRCTKSLLARYVEKLTAITDSSVHGKGSMYEHQARNMYKGRCAARGILGKACPSAHNTQTTFPKKELRSAETFMDRIHVNQLNPPSFAQVPEVFLNGDPTRRYPGNLNLSFAFIEGESLLMALKEVAVSSGSACTSASLEPSVCVHFYMHVMFLQTPALTLTSMS
jgi:hypothetical protein